MNLTDRPTPETNARAYDAGGHQHADGAPVTSDVARDLEQRVSALREALEPFVGLLQSHHEGKHDDQPVFGINKAEITVGQLRRARATNPRV